VPLVKLTPTEVEGCPRSCAGLVTTVTTLPPWGDGRSASAPAQRAGLPEGGSRIAGRARSELRYAIAELVDRPHLSAEHALRAKKSENRMDGHYHSAISALLDSGRPTADVLKAREIYRHLKNSADLIDRAADHVCMIVIKRL